MYVQVCTFYPLNNLKYDISEKLRSTQLNGALGPLRIPADPRPSGRVLPIADPSYVGEFGDGHKVIQPVSTARDQCYPMPAFHPKAGLGVSVRPFSCLHHPTV